MWPTHLARYPYQVLQTTSLFVFKKPSNSQAHSQALVHNIISLWMKKCVCKKVSTNFFAPHFTWWLLFVNVEEKFYLSILVNHYLESTNFIFLAYFLLISSNFFWLYKMCYTIDNMRNLPLDCLEDDKFKKSLIGDYWFLTITNALEFASNMFATPTLYV